MYISVRTWGLHHRVPHELVILFIYSCCLVLVDKSSKVTCLTSQKYLLLTKVKKHSLQQNTELYGKTINIFVSSHDAEHDGIQLFLIWLRFSWEMAL